MKSFFTALLAISSMAVGTLAVPGNALLTKRCNCNFNDIFAQVKARAEAAGTLDTKLPLPLTID